MNQKFETQGDHSKLMEKYLLISQHEIIVNFEIDKLKQAHEEEISAIKTAFEKELRKAEKKLKDAAKKEEVKLKSSIKEYEEEI